MFALEIQTFVGSAHLFRHNPRFLKAKYTKSLILQTKKALMLTFFAKLQTCQINNIDTTYMYVTINYSCVSNRITLQTSSTPCFKKVLTFKLFVTLSNLNNRFSKCLQCCKGYEICYKTQTTLPTSSCCCTTLGN